MASIATPNDVHAENAIAARRARGGTCSSRSRSPTPIEAAERIRDACVAGGRGADGRPRLPAARAPRGAPRSWSTRDGSGTVVLAEACFSLPGKLPPTAWRAQRARNPGGPLMQLGIHHVDTLAYLLGPVAQDHRPLRARAHRRRDRRRRGGDAGVRVGRARRADRLLRVAARVLAAAAGQRGRARLPRRPRRGVAGGRAGRRGEHAHARTASRWSSSRATCSPRSWPSSAPPMRGEAVVETGAAEGIAALRVILDAVGA